MRAVVLAALTLLALSPAAPAFGGRYRGPAEEVDPDLRQMQDPPPPHFPGSVLSSRGDGGGSSRYPSPTFESWRFWWRYNEESLLGIPVLASPLDPVVVEERIVPLLDRFARGLAPKVEGIGHQRDLQGTAILGLARLRRAERIPLLLELAGDRRGEHSVDARASACLALGLMGNRSPEVLAFLRTRAADGSGHSRIRCNAILGLGLLAAPDAGADPEGLAVLRAAILESPESRDVPLSALVAIGLIGDPAAVPDLLRWLREEHAGGRALDDLTLSYVAAALGRIGSPGAPGGPGREVVEALGALLKSSRPMPRFSAAIALGRIGSLGDAETVAACATALRAAIAAEAWTPRCPQTAQFAIASLGRIAGGTRTAPAERDAILRTLSGVLREGPEGARAFAALALAVGGRRLAGEAREGAASALRAALARSGESAEAGGAAAVALGLMRDGASAGTLRKLLASTRGDPRLRADAALALGLLGDATAIPELRKAVAQRDRMDLRHDATLALGLLRDRGAVDLLIERTGDLKTSRVHKGAAARALGWIGDAGAAERLIALTGDPEVNECERAAAVIALVRVATGGRDDDLARLSEDFNYRAWYYALGEVLSTL